MVTAVPAGRRRPVAMAARQEAILELARVRGYVSIEALSKSFGVSTQTVRRDIKQLCEWNQLARQHGGATLPPGRDKLAYSNRLVRHPREKHAIAQRVVEQIPNGASLFIDIGTTVEAVAEALLDHERLRIVTNHLGIVSTLSERTDFEIILAGGTVRKRECHFIDIIESGSTRKSVSGRARPAPRDPPGRGRRVQHPAR